VLAAALLGPAPGDRLVVVPRPDEAPTGGDGLLGLVPDGVWQLLALLVLALLLAVVWQGRRDGVVVSESLPPVLPSAELARSLAGLLQRRRPRRRRRAAAAGQPPDRARTLGLAPDTLRAAHPSWTQDAEVAGPAGSTRPAWWRWRCRPAVRADGRPPAGTAVLRPPVPR
jgi:hypothetical protein